MGSKPITVIRRERENSAHPELQRVVPLCAVGIPDDGPALADEVGAAARSSARINRTGLRAHVVGGCSLFSPSSPSARSRFCTAAGISGYRRNPTAFITPGKIFLLAIFAATVFLLLINQSVV
jgi:hypothetical protein